MNEVEKLQKENVTLRETLRNEQEKLRNEQERLAQRETYVKTLDYFVNPKKGVAGSALSSLGFNSIDIRR